MQLLEKISRTNYHAQPEPLTLPVKPTNAIGVIIAPVVSIYCKTDPYIHTIPVPVADGLDGYRFSNHKTIAVMDDLNLLYLLEKYGVTKDWLVAVRKDNRTLKLLAKQELYTF